MHTHWRLCPVAGSSDAATHAALYPAPSLAGSCLSTCRQQVQPEPGARARAAASVWPWPGGVQRLLRARSCAAPRRRAPAHPQQAALPQPRRAMQMAARALGGGGERGHNHGHDARVMHVLGFKTRAAGAHGVVSTSADCHATLLPKTAHGHGAFASRAPAPAVRLPSKLAKALPALVSWRSDDAVAARIHVPHAGAPLLACRMQPRLHPLQPAAACACTQLQRLRSCTLGL